MAELVGIQRCWDEATWIAYPPEVVKAACKSVCGEEMISDCWGDGGPQSGEFYECTSAYCEIVCTMPRQEMTYLEREDNANG